MASIQEMLLDDVVVLRDGVETTLPAASLVLGNIVQLYLGQKVPVDVKLIDVLGDHWFERSVLTAKERLTIRVGAHNCILFSNSFPANGSWCYC
jgi:sodium/potassium-transporting ATPase subunit alpha